MHRARSAAGWAPIAAAACNVAHRSSAQPQLQLQPPPRRLVARSLEDFVFTFELRWLPSRVAAAAAAAGTGKGGARGRLLAAGVAAPAGPGLAVLESGDLGAAEARALRRALASKGIRGAVDEGGGGDDDDSVFVHDSADEYAGDGSGDCGGLSATWACTERDTLRSALLYEGLLGRGGDGGGNGRGDGGDEAARGAKGTPVSRRGVLCFPRRELATRQDWQRAMPLAVTVGVTPTLAVFPGRGGGRGGGKGKRHVVDAVAYGPRYRARFEVDFTAVMGGSFAGRAVPCGSGAQLALLLENGVVFY